MKNLKWFAIGLCIDPAVYKDSMHIKFFESELEARACMYNYLCMYGTAYMGEVKWKNYGKNYGNGFFKNINLNMSVSVCNLASWVAVHLIFGGVWVQVLCVLEKLDIKGNMKPVELLNIVLEFGDKMKPENKLEYCPICHEEVILDASHDDKCYKDCIEDELGLEENYSDRLAYGFKLLDMEE